MPALIAHRGGAALWPENTLHAFTQAIERGAAGIEFDLQYGANGDLYVYHDETVRTTHWTAEMGPQPSPMPRFRDLSDAEIAKLDVGESGSMRRPAPFCPVANARVPKFAELLALIDKEASAEFRLYAELKTDMVRNDEAQRVSKQFIDAVRERSDLERFWVVSFDWRCLKTVREAIPSIKNAYTTLPFSETDPDATDQDGDAMAQKIRHASAHGAPWWGPFDWRDQSGRDHGEKVIRAIAAAGAMGWFAYWRDLTAERMHLARSLGLVVSAWTVNEADDMTAVTELGVDAIITDRPDLSPAMMRS